MLALVSAASLSGHPQLSLPAGLVDCCPVGVSLLGWRGGDEALLDVAKTLAPCCHMFGERTCLSPRACQPSSGVEAGARRTRVACSKA